MLVMLIQPVFIPYLRTVNLVAKSLMSIYSLSMATIMGSELTGARAIRTDIS